MANTLPYVPTMMGSTWVGSDLANKNYIEVEMTDNDKAYIAYEGAKIITFVKSFMLQDPCCLHFKCFRDERERDMS
jgi:hypothetical protein